MAVSQQQTAITNAAWAPKPPPAWAHFWAGAYVFIEHFLPGSALMLPLGQAESQLPSLPLPLTSSKPVFSPHFVQTVIMLAYFVYIMAVRHGCVKQADTSMELCPASHPSNATRGLSPYSEALVQILRATYLLQLSSSCSTETQSRLLSPSMGKRTLGHI
jgi:hypothetical protein